MIACKALRKIVSTGREKIISQILDDYSNILSIWLPKLLTNQSYQPEVLWSLINLYLVSTNFSQHADFGSDLIQNKIILILCNAISPQVDNNGLLMNLLSILLEDFTDSFPLNNAESLYRQKIEYFLSNDLICWNSEN